MVRLHCMFIAYITVALFTSESSSIKTRQDTRIELNLRQTASRHNANHVHARQPTSGHCPRATAMT